MIPIKRLLVYASLACFLAAIVVSAVGVTIDLPSKSELEDAERNTVTPVGANPWLAAISAGGLGIVLWYLIWDKPQEPGGCE